MNSIIEQVQKIIPNVYLVGGAVRDIILGVQPKDYDFCTPIVPDEVEKLVHNAGRKVYGIGKKYGTIGFKVETEPKQFQYVEITTFRGETYKTGSRFPEVTFSTDLTDDLSRRDFTVNAIAFNGKKFIDPFHGREDIESKTIRSVGNPTIRFKEDPLRLLRAVRFACKLGFNIDPITLKSICKNAVLINQISHERWVMEIDKILESEQASAGVVVLSITGLLKFIIPELQAQYDYDQNNPRHSLDLFHHTLEVLRLARQKTNNVDYLWGCLLHDIGKPATRTLNPKGYCNYVFHDIVGSGIVKKIGYDLKWSNERIEFVSNFVKNHMNDEEFKLIDHAAK